MIERLANAIYAVEGNEIKEPGESVFRAKRLDEEDEEMQALYFEYASAALAEMREPTEAMGNAGYAVGHEEAPNSYYEAMIDAAINEHQNRR